MVAIIGGELAEIFRCYIKKGGIMPVRKVKSGFRWGTKGKVYPTKAQALKQGKAIIISQKKAAKK